MLLSIIILVIASFMFGYWIRDIRDRLDWAVKLILSHAFKHPDHNKEPDEPIGQVVDPDEYDPVAAAKAEFEARTRKLNDK